MRSPAAIWRDKPHIVVLAGGTALALVLAGLQASGGFESWQQAYSDAERSVSNLSVIAEQEVASTLRGIDLSLKTAAELIEVSPGLRPDSMAVRAVLRERLKDLPFKIGRAHV